MAMIKADEIARNISPCPCCTGDYSGVIAALHEYGQAVRARDAKIAIGRVLKGPTDNYPDALRNAALADCAAAISGEPLP